MSALCHDILLIEEHTLVKVRIEIGPHQRVGDVGSPAHEVVDTTLWAVGIVDLQAVALADDIVTDSLQTVCCCFCQQCRRLQVAVDTGTHEVVGAKIADFQNRVGDDIRQGHELAAVLCRRCLYPGFVTPIGGGDDDKTADDDDDGGEHPFVDLFHVILFFCYIIQRYYEE